MQVVVEHSFSYAYTSLLELPPLGDHPHGEMRKAAFQTALDILHDHEAMIQLNPLVTSVELDDVEYVDVAYESVKLGVSVPEAPATMQYKIVDKLPLPFGYAKDLVYHAALHNLPSGMESITNAGGGVAIYGGWSLEWDEANENVLKLVEKDQIMCNWFLSLYIKSTLGFSHKTLHERFRDEWRGRLADALK